MLDRLTRLREERANSDEGFTLIELLVVVVIIGILIAIAIPLYLNYTKGASDKSAQSDVRGAVSALEQCNSDNGSYPSGLTPDSATAPKVYTPTGCTDLINVSSGTTLTYTYTAATGTAPDSYILVGTNKNGATKNYCYNSTKGGQVQSVGTATTC